jgi:hypothetical protein
LLALPPQAIAQQRVVSDEQIAARLLAAEAERAGNRLKVDKLLSEVAVAQAVRANVVALSDEELRDLARRADALEVDPVAGGVVKTLLILGLIVVVVVLLAAAIVESCKEQGAECLD